METEVEPSTEGKGVIGSGDGNGMDLIQVGYKLAELEQYKNFVKRAVHPREVLAGEVVLAKRDIRDRKNELNIDTVSKKRQSIKKMRDAIETEEDPKEIIKLIAAVKKARNEVAPLAKAIKDDKQLGGMNEGLRHMRHELADKVSAVQGGLGELGYQI